MSQISDILLVRVESIILTYGVVDCVKHLGCFKKVVDYNGEIFAENSEPSVFTYALSGVFLYF